MAEFQYRQQEPIAIIGFACRLPGGNSNPQKLWDFLERGEVAYNGVPKSRFNFEGHFDGSFKPGTMRQAGGMFLGDTDLADFDAGFFEVGGTEAVAMDPNQRQMLEVVYEGLENAGIPLGKLDNKPVGCFVGSFAADYADMQNRDPEDRPALSAFGTGRAILANRISHFLNIKGPSVTIDSACSASLQGLDLASHYLQSRTIDAAIVASSNLYMSPEHLTDRVSAGGAHSPDALCHTFDVAANGYVKAEAVNAVIVKRLSDAVRDRDPIRSVVLGTASNSNGRTPGIASPSAEAQALAIRAAYASAGITDFNATTYLECHGTGTQAGDPTEVRAAASVFSASRSPEKPLIIGSIKSNVGHSEPASGLSGLMKATMAIEKGIIPGNPTFINPSPKIDFIGNKVKASRVALRWPENSPRRASINSFGYGGSNAHTIIEQANTHDRGNYISSYLSADDEFTFDDDETARPYSLVLSTNDAVSLRANVKALCNHLINPHIKVSLSDLAYTLSERRTRLWHRAFISTRRTELEENAFVMAKKSSQPVKIGIVFTGQGAQWPQMAKDLLEFFPWTRSILEELDQVLQAQSNPPKWSLVTELTQPRNAEHLRRPEFAQPLVTALQLCIVAVLESWGLEPSSAVGHSSGEIAAAYMAGFLDRAGAIKAAFYRGRAAVNRKADVETDVGMLAVGLSAKEVSPFLETYRGSVWIACFNSPSALTISGKIPALEAIAQDVKAAGQFARFLQVDLAYHSDLMDVIGEEYQKLLDSDDRFEAQIGSSRVAMFSSVTASKKDTPADALYWKTNMVSPVHFAEALKEMITVDSPNFLIEVGPSGALAGPVSQVLKSLPNGENVSYCASWSRGVEAGKSLFDVAGRLFVSGASIDMSVVNMYDSRVRTIIDLPNYNWNHTVKYWHENASSKDWRFRKYVVHDLLGSKIIGTPWHTPIWRNNLNVANVPWLLDHKMGGNVIMPAAGFITLALEALYQKHCALNNAAIAPNDLCYQFRNVRFSRALVLEEGKDTVLMLALSVKPGNTNWHKFRISTCLGDDVSEHCSGLARIQDPIDEYLENTAPLKFPQPSKLWYKGHREIGMDFGPAFQKVIKLEATSGQRTCRTLVSLSPPDSKWTPQSYYPLHPAALDGCFQTPIPANAQGHRIHLHGVMIPAIIDEVIINKVPARLHEGLSSANSFYSGRGRLDLDKSWKANTSVYDSKTGALVVRVTGLNYVKLDVSPKADPHTFHRISWKPDVTFLTQDQMIYLEPASNSTKVDTVIDLIAFKKPALKILEVNLDDRDTECMWFSTGDLFARAAYSAYTFASSNPKALANNQAQYEDKRNTSFLLVDQNKEALGISQELVFDLIIVKTSQKAENNKKDIVKGLTSLLSNEAITLLVVNEEEVAGDYFDSADSSESANQTSIPESPSQYSGSLVGERTTSLDSWDDAGAKLRRESDIVHNSSSLLEITAARSNSLAYLWRNANTETLQTHATRNLVVVHLAGTTPRALPPSLHAKLEASGWTITHHGHPISKPTGGDTILIIDELTSPLLTKADERQWEALKMLTSSGNALLWVTKGAQHRVTHPDNAMVHGLFRVARRENGISTLTTLDVQSNTSTAMSWAIDQVLRLLRKGTSVDTEYMERDGILHVQRLIPDDAVNEFKRSEVEGLEPVIKSFYRNEAQVKLRAERLGTLQSLMWCETDMTEVPLEAGEVEVEVMAVGVNFKDVAITMDIVPGDEYNLGIEAAGIVKQLGLGVSKFKVGDRVCMHHSGTYANRVRVSVDRCHEIPAAMSFEDAATIPSVYLCSLYAMYHLANLKEGQSILIHSATGGVGLACIQLAQYKKAQIYVTVGTEEKRQFLESNYGIPRSRMFSSRNAKFAREILQNTGGRGVDVIINSLVGELLDASWRIVADGGTMVEIGKRDIVDRNTLAMEPFDRNCSFRAVDMSYTKDMSDSKIPSLFDELFVLIDGGYLKPIHPITTFGFDAVPAALTHIRAGRHIGKIVISNHGNEDISVPIRAAVRRLQLQPDVSFLIVGGLKGACGTLAIHMAKHGARHIIVCSRSGLNDVASARMVNDCNSHGCDVVEASLDVGDSESVDHLFKTTSPRIAGIIQGAMVLRDKPYEMMTLDDYHTAIHAKVEGTWNLHRASQKLQQQLQFFTMLSSTSGIVGKKGQANYAAANTFLDAFASYRQSLGLRANTVDLGLIEDVGYVAEQDTSLELGFDKRQWTPINEAMLRRILTYSIMQQDATVPLNADSSAEMITGISFPLSQDGSDLTHQLRFSYLFNSPKAGVVEDSPSDSIDLVDQAVRAFRMIQNSGADVAALNEACVEVLSAQLVKILGFEGEVEAGKRLVAYGLDSLSAVELRNWIRLKLAVELSTLDITNASSFIALAEKVVSKLMQSDQKGGNSGLV